MLGRDFLKLLNKNVQPKFCVPKRNWTQVGMIISTPPRVHVSYGEKVLHIAFMSFVWFAPMAYLLSQVKVWRRQYIQEQS